MKNKIFLISKIFLFVVLLNSCTGTENETYTLADSTVTVGQLDKSKGGVIAYIFKQGEPRYVEGQIHGIIVSEKDQSSGLQWSNGNDVFTNASGFILGTGNSNTTSIVSYQGSGSYAAKLCFNLTLNGLSDWYLPSYEELKILNTNRHIIGGLNSKGYWSSSERDISTAFIVDFRDNLGYYSDKSEAWAVRAVRTF